MNYTNEFVAGFICEAPAFLPTGLKERLVFLSCLSEKENRMVYLCKDIPSGERVVLKITGGSSPNSMSREYEFLKKISHEAVPRALDYLSDEAGREYLLRSFAEGETLNCLIDRDGVFDERQTLTIIQKICTILSYLHGQTPPIIYRDIKPQNIVITVNGKITLIDFGISREENDNKDFDTVYLGSVAFAAPEQFGFTKTDSRSDVFALGKLMLYLCTGQTKLPDFKEIVESKSLARLISKCTELSPDKRFSSVGKLNDAIARILNPPTRKELVVGSIAAMLIIISGLTSLIWLNSPTTNPPATATLRADGGGYEDEVKIPVMIQTLFNGKPFSDCAVAVDNHHWFVPAANGKAELVVFAFDDYKVRMAYENRTAFVMASVTREDEPVSISFDLAKTPTAPSYLPLSLVFGEKHDIPLDITNAKEVTLYGQPQGISIVGQQDGTFRLVVEDDVEEPGHYTLFVEATNDDGKADTVLALFLEKQKEVIRIDSAEEFVKVSDNLSGNYLLTADIDISGIDDWMPIGKTQYPFTGVFDGGGHTITGLTIQNFSTGKMIFNGLFGVVSRGTVRNLIVENADIHTSNDDAGGTGVLVGKLESGLVENCAVLSGEINADISMESSAGGIVGVNTGVVKSCFSSANVSILTSGSKERTETYAGGICGKSEGYVADSGNTGNVTGISVAGGVVGFNDMGILTRCYNAGTVKSPVFATSYPAGGISHLLGRGKIISYCAFASETAQVGATVFNGGTLLGIVPVDKDDLKSMDVLNRVFHISDAQDKWTYNYSVSEYPVPKELYEE